MSKQVYEPSLAELMFQKLGYYKYECKYLDCFMYKNKAHEIYFSNHNKTIYAQINESDINFGKYRPMEIDADEFKCIVQQLEELGWKGEKLK